MPPVELLAARFEVQDVVNAFAAAFDAHDWDALRVCLDDEVFLDYSDLRGDPPTTSKAGTARCTICAPCIC